MSFAKMSAEEFTQILSSKSPVPGGGGAAAMCAADAASLGGMVCALTSGKKKFVQHEERIKELSALFDEKRIKLLALVDEDAESFMPLSEAYKLPKDAPDRDIILEEALYPAAETPMRVMRICGELIELFFELKDKSSALAVSDVGVGVKTAAAALESASLNVFINTALMKNDFRARIMEQEADELCSVYLPMADEVFAFVTSSVRKKRDL